MGPGALIFCHPSDEHYGADRILLDIVDSLGDDVRSGVEVWLPVDLPHAPHPLCVVLERRGVAVRHVDLPIMRRAYMTPSGLRAVARRALVLRRLLRQRRPGIVYCTTSASFVCAAVARSSRVPHVVGHVQEVWSAQETRLIGPLARGCHQLVTISDAVRRSLPPRLRGRARVVRNATPDPGSFEPLERHGGPLRYLVAGRWNGMKGHGTLLRAWEMAGAPGELVVLGGPPASGSRVDVTALVSGLTRPGTVRVVGEVDDPAPYYDEADVVVVPSDEPEGFGLTAVEAFARGRPVVATGIGGMTEIVTDAEDGWLFPPKDAEALARILCSLDRPTVEAAGLRARRSYERGFTVKRYGEDLRSALPFLA